MLAEQTTATATPEQQDISSCNPFAHDALAKHETSDSNSTATTITTHSTSTSVAGSNTITTTNNTTSTITTTTTTTDTMTKQLTTAATTTAATISTAQLVPTAISPTVQTTSVGDDGVANISGSTSPADKAGLTVAQAMRKDSVASTASTAELPASQMPSPGNIGTATANVPLQQQQQQPKGKSPNDASGRSAALERAYVHDVYENCEEPCGTIRPRVAQFLSNLDAGSVVCDVGCGSGRYLTQCNPAICTVGVDRCHRLSKVAREKGGEVTLCDNLELPFRDESFDAVLSLAVVHHFATTERRISALRELARILRIGGRVVISVWALEQRHRRFESQDVLIPWQPPKNRNFNYSDEEDDDDFLPPYHAYTEDSTNSSRSAGDGDSSSLSSSSPGESCYSFVRRAIQKLAGGRKHPWFLESWTSKETKNDSSLDYEDAKDLPIELRRLEDFEDFTDPPLSAGLKSRSLGSILNPPPRQIVRSRSSVPSLGGPLLQLHGDAASFKAQTQNAQFLAAFDGAVAAAAANGHSPTHLATAAAGSGSAAPSATSSLGRRPKLIKQKQSLCDEDYQLPEQPFHVISSYNNSSYNSSLYMKSGCYHSGGAHQHPHHQSATRAAMPRTSSVFLRKQSSLNEELMAGNRIREKERVRKRIQKQMSLNEAFLCRSGLFAKRLQVIREGFTSKIKHSTGSLERVTKSGLTKIMQNFKAGTGDEDMPAQYGTSSSAPPAAQSGVFCPHQQHHHHHHMHQQQAAPQHSQSTSGSYRSHLQHLLHRQTSLGGAAVATTPPAANKYAGPVVYCNSAECASTSQSACYCATYHHGCSGCAAAGCAADVQGGASSLPTDDPEAKARRHSRESGSDSSKDSSLQSDTSIESEDSFASVIFIPKPEQHQQQLNYQQQHQNSNSSSSNSSSSNGGCCQPKGCTSCAQQQQQPQQQQQQSLQSTQSVHCKAHCTQASNGHHHHGHQHHHRNIPSVPTSPLIMPCPPTPAHSPAAAQMTATSPPQTMAAVTAAMAILTPPCAASNERAAVGVPQAEQLGITIEKKQTAAASKNRFTFDEAHIAHQQLAESQQQEKITAPPLPATQPPTKAQAVPIVAAAATRAGKITRQIINELPPIPKFRKQQSLQLHRQSFPLLRRSSATAGALPSIPKLLSLELFNPATDDLDSDSSEPSSPDSIDSVISAAPKSASISTSEPAKAGDTKVNPEESDIANMADFEHIVRAKQQQYHNGDLKINAAAPNDIILNDDSSSILQSAHLNHQGAANASHKAQDCNEFAEQLSAQLLREIEDKKSRIECRSLDGMSGSDISDFLDDAHSGNGSGNGNGNGNGSGSGSVAKKQRNGGEQVQRDLTALREELRERRLMLANLSTQPSLQQSPSSSTSSLSSQTRSFTIHEEDEDEVEEENERSYTLQLYENCKISKFNYKRNRHYNLNPETAYLLQDDGDSSIRDDDDMDDFEHSVILEEDEEAAAAEDMAASQATVPAGSQSHALNSTAATALSAEMFGTHEGLTVAGQARAESSGEAPLQARQSTESWEHSNSSTTSLDSPSQQGGATTHHRYYHVFREGELDALINHHVASLHIVSSYYERASWCVVAEKVQVWTI